MINMKLILQKNAALEIVNRAEGIAEQKPRVNRPSSLCEVTIKQNRSYVEIYQKLSRDHCRNSTGAAAETVADSVACSMKWSKC
jgi:hypothetical protein